VKNVHRPASAVKWRGHRINQTLPTGEQAKGGIPGRRVGQGGQPNYRTALIDTSIILNAALTVSILCEEFGKLLEG
jgi:hypothetical protein